MPFFEAQKLQRFVNLGEATADERWAKYAFQRLSHAFFCCVKGIEWQ